VAASPRSFELAIDTPPRIGRSPTFGRQHENAHINPESIAIGPSEIYAYASGDPLRIARTVGALPTHPMRSLPPAIGSASDIACGMSNVRVHNETAQGRSG
jgi:hypothetical protein